MKEKNCTAITNYAIVKNYILKNGRQIRLSERLVCDLKTTAQEVAFEDKFIEYVVNDNDSKIIIINRKEYIPAYFCQQAETQLILQAYASCFETEDSLKERELDWCNLVSKILGQQ